MLGKSSPRAATSVQKRTPCLQREKSRNVCVLSFCTTLIVRANSYKASRSIDSVQRFFLSLSESCSWIDLQVRVSISTRSSQGYKGWKLGRIAVAWEEPFEFHARQIMHARELVFAPSNTVIGVRLIKSHTQSVCASFSVLTPEFAFDCESD